MSLMTRKQVSQANGISREAAQEWARQTAQYLRARQLVAQAQLAPLAANARVAARQGVYGARARTAPWLDSMGQVLQEQWAPRMSAMLSAYARRIEPVPAKPPRRRWPAVAAGIVVIAGGSVAAMAILKRRNNGPAAETGEPGETASSPATPREMAAEAVGADVNGQTQSP